MAGSNYNATAALTQRLLKDIHEIEESPYPNIFVHINDANMCRVCLVLTPEQGHPLHLTVQFYASYPLAAPRVTIQSRVEHPNVFDDYICATMLNTDAGWTPAYTLKGIAIQLLSFFSSDRLEQDHGNGYVDLAQYRDGQAQVYHLSRHPDDYTCRTCGFGTITGPHNTLQNVSAPSQQSMMAGTNGRRSIPIPHVPDEIWLQIFSYLDTQHLVTFSDAFRTIKEKLNSFDFIRTQELQCFCLKKNFLETKLGVGVSVGGSTRKTFRSEFDLLSEEAFTNHGVRKSVLQVSFTHWLPLPLNQRHWNSVRSDVDGSLNALHQAANMGNADNVDVLYSFMNSIVVQFSLDALKSGTWTDVRSTLNHASEKAVESYFALFHLLLCLAVDRPEIVTSANNMVARFLQGPRTKTHFPDIGHLLIASLISDAGLTYDIVFSIIRESILRNVVWMLDSRPGCAGMPELAYLEPNAISHYRFKKTFEASKTSYRLLMFTKLFSSTARTPGKTLTELRDSLFDSHGAPHPDVSIATAQKTREIRNINNFEDFLEEMGVKTPIGPKFSTFLKRTITDSAAAGYSCMPLTQGQAYLLRRDKDPGVDKTEGLVITRRDDQWKYASGRVLDNAFFPGGQRLIGATPDHSAGGWRGRGR